MIGNKRRPFARIWNTWRNSAPRLDWWEPISKPFFGFR